MKPFYMDAHMHFDLYKDRKSIANYIEQSGSYTIAVTNLPALFERYYSEYQGYKYMKIALGFHPELAYKYQEQLPVFLRNIDNTRYIGEIGLDFSTRDFENRQIQIKIFTEIIQKCSERKNKIISVHSRKAQKDVLEILKEFQGNVILHWYSGSIKEIAIAVDRGYYFSINHQMFRSDSGRKNIDAIPLNRILIESDAPFTISLKDKYNLFFINEIYSCLEKSKGLDLEEISKTIKENFSKILS
ncbi:TatD family hydrolase [Sporomusa sphaeroides]|uniref:Qat anti-phage system TatD family nuclease QatD n=1 Tax=Sporomusa sphaeroides TaxID=47679 RepID=UPI003DA1B235